MTKNNTPQSKHKKANLNNSRNTSKVTQKSHNSWEHQTKLLLVVASLKSLMEGGSGRNHIQEDNSESDCDIHKCMILQNELRTTQHEVMTLKTAQHEFTSRYIGELLCFYEILHSDITEFLKLERDQEKSFNLTNIKNTIEALIKHSNKLITFTNTLSNTNPLLHKKITSKELFYNRFNETGSKGKEFKTQLYT